MQAQNEALQACVALGRMADVENTIGLYLFAGHSPTTKTVDSRALRHRSIQSAPRTRYQKKRGPNLPNRKLQHPG